MDYGQPVNCTNEYCGNHCTQELPQRKIEQVIPDYVRQMLAATGIDLNDPEVSGFAGQLSRLMPVTAAVPPFRSETGSETVFSGDQTTWMPTLHERKVPTVKRTAQFRDPQFGRMLANCGYNADAILRAIAADDNSTRQMREVLGEQQWQVLLSEIIFSDNVTESSLLAAGAQAFPLGQMELRRVTPQAVKPKPPVSQQCQIVGAISTLADVISGHVIPDFMQQLADALDIDDPTERLREQYKIASRFQKLMRYSRKPGMIDPANMHCKHELAIYKWTQLAHAVRGDQTEAEALANIRTATEAFLEKTDPKKVSEEHTEAQAVNLRRAQVMEKIIGEVGNISALVEGLETNLLAKKLRDLAEDLDRAESGEEPAEQVQLPWEQYMLQPDHNTGVAYNASVLAGDMGMDYSRQVPTTPGGYSDDKFGAPTRRGLTGSSLPARADIQITLDRPSARPHVFSPDEQQRAIDAANSAGRVNLGARGPGLVSAGLGLGALFSGQPSGIPASRDIQSSPLPVRAQIKPEPLRGQTPQEFVLEMIARLNRGENVGEAELLKAAEFSKTLICGEAGKLAQAVGLRLARGTQFLQ